MLGRSAGNPVAAAPLGVSLALPLVILLAIATDRLRAQDVGAASELRERSVATAPSPDPLELSGNTVHRWQLESADATWVQGDAELRHGDSRWIGESFLIVTSGPVGNVTNRIVAAGLRGTQGVPKSWVQMTMDDPRIDARRYLGTPTGEVDLVAHLPTALPSPSESPPTLDAADVPFSKGFPSGVMPVQYTEPVPSSLPTGGVEEGWLADGWPSDENWQSFETPVPLDPPLASPIPGAPRLDSQTNVPALNPPQVNYQPPVNGSSTLPPPPTVMADGATTGGSVFAVAGGTKTFEITGRGQTSPPEFQTLPRVETGEDVILARGGVTVLVRDVAVQIPTVPGITQLGTVSISADRVVAWTPPLLNVFSGDADLSQADGELYLEGDVVFRAGEQVIYADSMYYNVAQDRGMILDAEAITTIPEYQGVVRLKAEVLQQVARGNFVAFDAAVTTSRLGVPRYWLQSEQLQLTQKSVARTDPNTGETTIGRRSFVESNNNFVYLAGVPVLFWPTFTAPLEVPTFYISGADVKNDDIFGTQVLLDWNLFQLLGIDDAPAGVKWDLSTDYLSDRGPALGTTLEYRIPGLFGLPGPVKGFSDTWVIDDDGLDTLGGGRRDLQPEESIRGRSLLQHRHYLPSDYELIAEIGWISDRNFLEQFLESEWDQDVDHRTALRLRRYFGSHLFDLSAQVQVNEFFTETERLPELEHYHIGGSYLGDRLTVSMHNRVGFEILNPADAPDDLALTGGSFTLAPGVVESEGLVAGSQGEVALPIQLGPLKVVPNLTREVTYYGEAVDGDDLTRWVAGGGVRVNLPMWRVDPNVQSNLLNVRGLAHKVNWHAEYVYADSDTDLDEVPFYDSLDDTAQEEFRRRFTFDTFGGALPVEFDPRTYAFRQGYQSLIASPSDSIADDLQQVRLGVHQRFQTKRGLPGSERIVDLFELNVDTILFPRDERDNFGETVGPTTYDATYRLGDRVSVLSDGYFDFFDDGLRSVSAGLKTSRPGLGDVYVGLLSLEGPISSTVLRANLNYRLNEKWITSAGTTFDFGETGNVGQTLGLTRIGESFLVRVGVNVDEGRDNVGVRFAIEPRFLPRGKLGRLGGELIPPPGVQGLE